MFRNDVFLMLENFKNSVPVDYSDTAICVQALTANIFSRLFTFETARLKF